MSNLTNTTSNSSWATPKKKKGFDGIIVVIGLVLLVLILLLVFQGRTTATMNTFMADMDTKIQALSSEVGSATGTHGTYGGGTTTP